MLPVAPRSVLLNGTVAILLLVLAIFPGLMLAQQRGVVLQAPTQIMNVGAVSSSEPTGSRLMSLSTRGEVSGDERVLIGGLIIGGTTPRKVLLRALGPTLAEAVPGALADPRLRLMNGQGQELARNDNWREQSEVGAIQATGLAPAHAREAALLAELAPGAYTAIVEGVNNTSGTTLLEAHPLDGQSSRLMSLSTRGDVASQDRLLIGGFVIGGPVPKTVLIRGLGPSLSQAVRGALADPWLELAARPLWLPRSGPLSLERLLGGRGLWGLPGKIVRYQSAIRAGVAFGQGEFARSGPQAPFVSAQDLAAALNGTSGPAPIVKTGDKVIQTAGQMAFQRQATKVQTPEPVWFLAGHVLDDAGEQGAGRDALFGVFPRQAGGGEGHEVIHANRPAILNGDIGKGVALSPPERGHAGVDLFKVFRVRGGAIGTPHRPHGRGEAQQGEETEDDTAADHYGDRR